MDTTPVLDTSSSCADIRARFDAIVRDLEQVRAADRTVASDDARLGWIEPVRGVQRRVDVLAAILIGEADEANSALRAGHSHLQDWLAQSGQETPRQATATLWTARELERRPKIRDAAAVGQISLGQAKSISTALNVMAQWTSPAACLSSMRGGCSSSCRPSPTGPTEPRKTRAIGRRFSRRRSSDWQTRS